MGAIKALSETLARVLEQQDGLSNGDTDKNEAKTMHVAIVSHGRTNKVLLTSMLTGDAGIILEKVGQENAGVSVFDHNGFDDVGEKKLEGRLDHHDPQLFGTHSGVVMSPWTKLRILLI